MCTNYRPSDKALIESLWDLAPPLEDWAPEAYEDGAAPIVRAGPSGGLECVLGTFGFVPQRIAKTWQPRAQPQEASKGKRAATRAPLTTMNARAETIATKPTYGPYWRDGHHLCLIPATGVYEPNYEANGQKGPSIRYRLWVRDEPAFAIAGMWRTWPSEDSGAEQTTFTMITVNADHHAVFKRMHKPFLADGKTPNEKRGVVIVPRKHWADWLTCSDAELARTFLGLYPSERMDCAPDPRAPRATKPM